MSIKFFTSGTRQCLQGPLRRYPATPKRRRYYGNLSKRNVWYLLRMNVERQKPGLEKTDVHNPTIWRNSGKWILFCFIYCFVLCMATRGYFHFAWSRHRHMCKAGTKWVILILWFLVTFNSYLTNKCRKAIHYRHILTRGSR